MFLSRSCLMFPLKIWWLTHREAFSKLITVLTKVKHASLFCPFPTKSWNSLTCIRVLNYGSADFGCWMSTKWKVHRTDRTNIARGTTDPGYWVRNLNNLFSWYNFKLISVRKMIQVLDLIPWIRCSTFFSTFFFNFFSTCQGAFLALVPILATRWRY